MDIASRPVSLKDIRVKDDFWEREMELVRKEVLPYQWEALNDRVPDAAPSFCIRNFKVAGRITRERKELGDSYKERTFDLNTFETLPEDMSHLEERFYGFVFQDSDFFKWIEAVAYSLTQHPDSELEKTADEAIDIVCAAQQENGYLDTYYIINDMSKVFTNLKDNHELYCFGHLTEGACAYYQATGKDKLLYAARRYADYIAACFGDEDGKKKGYPGHEIAEMALIRLYEVTGEKKYLALSEFFLNHRGTRPYYFDLEKQDSRKEEKGECYQYHQAHIPVRQQKEAVGHAVRAVYLYSGMADIARLTEDKAMLEACETLWDNIIRKKMYITGGIGGTHIGEAFSFDYDLPDDTAYAETCASIGLVFFARRMLEIKADRKYADVMETALYNGILSGMALDGKSFFYVNPLKAVPEACYKDQRKFHVKPVRQKWFGCACCPPNIARLISSAAAYAYTENENTLFLHLYMGGIVKKKTGNAELVFEVKSGLPWDGNVQISTWTVRGTACTVALRLPGWCSSYTVNGENGTFAEGESNLKQQGFTEAFVKNGYLYLTRKWENGDTLEIQFEMPVRIMQASRRVSETEGRVAITRGPIVYCLEEADNGKELHNLYIDVEARKEWQVSGEVGSKMVLITAEGKRYRDADYNKELYREFEKPLYEPVKLKWIPYYAWANRGEGEMQVWTRYF